jgi:hypothetical protein
MADVLMTLASVLFLTICVLSIEAGRGNTRGAPFLIFAMLFISIISILLALLATARRR